MKAEESRDNDRFRLAPNGVPWERYFPWWSKREEARKLPRADRLQYLIDFLEEQPRCEDLSISCLLYTSPSPRDRTRSRMPSSA